MNICCGIPDITIPELILHCVPSELNLDQDMNKLEQSSQFKKVQNCELLIKTVRACETCLNFDKLHKRKEKRKLKEVAKIDKDDNESVVTISYKIKFIDSATFMASLLSNLVDNLAEGIHKIKCRGCDCFLEYESVKDNLIKYKCLSCDKDYSNKIDEELKKRFKNTFKFSENDIKKIFLLLRKGVYPYEYMNEWEKFNETTLPEKEKFYSSLNMEDITDADYMHRKRVYKDFEIKNLKEYHDLYVQSNILLLADVFETFRNMCLKVYELNPSKFLSTPRLTWQAALKKTQVKLDLLTDIDMLLMVEKGIRGGICHSIHRYAKVNNKYIKDYDRNKESLYLKYWDVNNLCRKSFQ